MTKLVAVAVGGAVGSLLRYWLHGWLQNSSETTFPVGTMAVNLVGCLAIGILSGLFAGPILIREEYRIGLTVGLLGGFTTFSTFGLETFQLARAGQFWFAMANLVLSCAIGLGAVWLGYRLAERWMGA